MAEAAFALWLLGGMRGYTQRDPVAARLRLHQAAEAGHPEACWVVGNEAWRRGEDVAALRWWLRASERGHVDAGLALDKQAPEVLLPAPELLAAAMAMRACDGVMALRLELAAHFHLARHEFLLIDPAGADAGDFLMVDVREGFGKAKRHGFRISLPAQREVLDRARFGVGMNTLPIGNYRALLRRFKLLCGKAGIALVER